MRKWLVQLLTPVLCGLAVLLCVILAGRAARASLHDRSTYSLDFADIDCLPPEGLLKADFLSEVENLTSQPRTLHLLDGDLAPRLHRAFLAHPCVESVRRVVLQRCCSSAVSAERKVRIEIEYRRPTLAIPLFVSNERQTGKRENGWRIVDRRGILLPSTDLAPLLPVLVTDVTAPSSNPGCHWGDARVTAAAQTAAFLIDHLTQLHLEHCRMEVLEGEIMLHQPGVRILWGHAPGQERAEEAPAKIKLSRLLDYQQKQGSLDRLEHDVRMLAYQGRFPLPPDQPAQAVSLNDSSLLPSSRKRDVISNSSQSWRSCFNEAKTPSASASSR